jgi:hypothetical protein
LEESFDFVVDLLEQLDITNVKMTMKLNKFEVEHFKGIVFD